MDITQALKIRGGEVFRAYTGESFDYIYVLSLSDITMDSEKINDQNFPVMHEVYMITSDLKTIFRGRTYLWKFKNLIPVISNDVIRMIEKRLALESL